EEGPVAAVGEGGQAHVAGGGAHRLGGEVVAAGELEAADPVEDVRPPGAVVDGRAHQVPVLAVVGQGDADLALLGDDVHHRLAEDLAELVGRCGGEPVLSDGAGGVGGDQLGAAREGTGVGGEDLGHGPDFMRRSRARRKPRSSPFIWGHAPGGPGAAGPPGGAVVPGAQSRGQVGTRFRSPKAWSMRRTGGQHFDWIRICALSCTESSSCTRQLPASTATSREYGWVHSPVALVAAVCGAFTSGLSSFGQVPATTSSASFAIISIASTKRSISARSSDSVGSIMNVPATGKDMVGAWKP